ncbi:MAG: AEC family transporter [Candidatus Omnitrophica bacterium]|nr:AEC family transporter [Candidatus Omnitrophota bacterium]MDD5027521.1 AEC family transporter [Candidatus Omnitrophota bacterium]MDD5662495.1 AEC family transporter [Candidatus Omnitrophota bacterium]
MPLAHFKITGIAVAQILLLAALGYWLVRRRFLASAGVEAISSLVMDVTLPALIFCQLIRDFSFQAFADWWIFPLLSILVTLIGLLAGFLFAPFIKGEQHKLQFISLVAFQNSGYLPLALVAALLAPESLSVMFIYIFLFLAGFNLVMFSVGVHILNFHKEKKFIWLNLLSAPVVVTLVSLVIIFFGLNKFVPDALIKPLFMLGESTLPLAMLVVGAGLAQVSLKHIDKKAISMLILAKMFVLPAIGLALVIIFKVPGLIGLLIIIQLAMPSAVTLSTILRSYKKEDLLVSQGILLTHLSSIITIPLFLILYFSRIMLK